MDAVVGNLEWRDFEVFVSRAFESFGYDVKHDFRFKYRGVRRQVDVVATQGRRVFSVDCKHWSKTRGLGAPAQRQVERSALLAEYLEDKEVYPMIVTLGFNGYIEDVPIVASYSLRDFLLNLDQYIDTLRVLH
ncbi:MAG: restriction endonuclease [Thermoprotei archaeon]